MPIIQATSSPTGLVGVQPNIIFLNTTDTLAVVTTTGYLTAAVKEQLVQIVVPTSQHPGGTIAFVNTTTGPILLKVVVTGIAPNLVYSLAELVSGGGAIFQGNVQAGINGIAGCFISYPATLNTGYLEICATANSSNFPINVTNAPFGQATTLTIPNPGTATADFALAPQAMVNGDLVMAQGTAGLIIDSGITASSVAALIAGSGSGGSGVRSATIAGTFPTATTVITDPAITANSVVIAAFVSSANVVSIQTVLPAAGQFTINTDTAPSTGVLEYISFTPSPALVTAGVVAGKTSFSSGPATFVMSAPGITPGMVVVANFQVQGTPSRIYTALPGTDQITFVVSSGPGVSVMEWVGMLPGDIAPLGLHAADYSYGGGAASVVIADASITASSIVVANFKSEAGANYIQKVTPSAGTLTVLVNADPGVSVIAYIATASAGGGGGGSSTTPQTTSVSTASATPGTIRSITGTTSDAATTITSGNLVGVRGATQIVGISGGFIYGTQGKIIATGTIANSGGGFEAPIFGQFDISAATLGATSYMAPIWGDYGSTATAGTYPQAWGLAMTNSTAAILGAQVFLYGGATDLFNLIDNNGLVGPTYFLPAGVTAGSWGNAPTPTKVLRIAVNGVTYYLPLCTQNT